ncbi:MAG: hypothetical protein ACLQOO_02505 [Terriglobia bacterium]
MTYALNRTEARLDSAGWRWFRTIFFDWTCQYGMSPGRPLLILVAAWLLCSLLNYSFIRLSRHSGIYVLPQARLESAPHGSPRTIQRVGKLSIRASRVSSYLRRFSQGNTASRRWLVFKSLRWRLSRHTWRYARAAMFFSLMSAFNIGFRDINFGRWLRLLTKREYDLKATGWARTVSGVQSLFSVYMVALWLLTYFGRPFAQ